MFWWLTCLKVRASRKMRVELGTQEVFTFQALFLIVSVRAVCHSLTFTVEASSLCYAVYIKPCERI
ncbi:hypothetical protein M758_4G101800 [Ceratodon purpureus]|nr:hypothetical protein M758_4G101800 [Ceratodon purpureus]